MVILFGMQSGSPYDHQTARIAVKLGLARTADPAFNVFGARVHRYDIGRPLTHADVLSFEHDHGVALPPDFKAFLTDVGHAGRSGHGAAAGPFYGVMSLSAAFSGFGAAQMVPTITSTMTEAEWQDAVAGLDRDDPGLSDAENDARSDAAFSALFGGLLRLGHQGCESYHALVLSGPDSGRVVNVDTDLRMPKFAPDRNFLDWYERWLDQVIDGTLLRSDAGWFGYHAEP